ncbi:hypothetical protein [Enterococcus casseliflavus]|uniref:hypothetical protein n=1 Tax=Enterococcus casseliflavus TaxID=37734 RepID=UPI00115E3FE4|nr:hypothetical protein [Enterococcus casseliflavus]
MRQTESLLLLGVFVVGLFVVYWLKKHRQARHNQAMAAQLKRYPSVRQAWLAAGANREAVLLVPGLKEATAAVATTATAKAETRLHKHADQCQAMTPQGLAVSEDYLFLSAYCSQQEHHSQLYIIERTSGRHLKTVVLPKRPHVGGLVFERATQMLWLTITGKGMGRVACVSLQALLEDDSLATNQPIAYQQVIELAGITHSSYLAADGEELVSGTFALKQGGVAANYPLPVLSASGRKAPHRIKPRKRRVTTTKVQSIAFTTEYMLLARSFGPGSAELWVFSKDATVLTRKHALRRIKFPHYLEQIVVEKGQLYCLFESGAWAYRQKGGSIDEVVVLDLATLLQ